MSQSTAINVTNLGWFGKYKWRLNETYVYFIPIKDFNGHGANDYVSITQHGKLFIKKGYCWDGASGPTWDTDSCRRGSMVHDALYQLIREGIIPKTCKGIADKILHDILIEDGMWKWRADGWYWAVDNFGKYAI